MTSGWPKSSAPEQVLCAFSTWKGKPWPVLVGRKHINKSEASFVVSSDELPPAKTLFLEFGPVIITPLAGKGKWKGKPSGENLTAHCKKEGEGFLPKREREGEEFSESDYVSDLEDYTQPEAQEGKGVP